MNILESFRVALTGLMMNRLRSVLTMLGIIIGVGAVIALVSFGQGFQDFVNRTFQSIGSNLVFVAPSLPSGAAAKIVRPKPLTMTDVQAIANPMYVPGVAAVAPQYMVNVKVVAEANDVTIQVIGTTPVWQTVRDWTVNVGRFFDESEVSSAARVAVLGTSTVKKLFESGTDPVGQEIRINNIPFRVIGVLTSKGGAGFTDQDQTVMVPITTAQTRLGPASARTTSGAYQVSLVYVKAMSDQNVAAVKRSIETLLFDLHEVQFQGEEDFQVISSEQVLSILGNITGLLTTFLALIAGISLVVGGIGVMNIMLVSVTERTREIGLRKAVGARYGDLMLQFLIESVTLCVAGGMVGILIGFVVAVVGTALIPNLVLTVTLPAVLLATGVSTAIGIFFGLYPASRAASLNPIEALRYE